jgi:hypothetical protein
MYNVLRRARRNFFRQLLDAKPRRSLVHLHRPAEHRPQVPRRMRRKSAGENMGSGVGQLEFGYHLKQAIKELRRAYLANALHLGILDFAVG